jgi:hypothetical protein
MHDFASAIVFFGGQKLASDVKLQFLIGQGNWRAPLIFSADIITVILPVDYLQNSVRFGVPLPTKDSS